jgi:hypothetical protein
MLFLSGLAHSATVPRLASTTRYSGMGGAFWSSYRARTKVYKDALMALQLFRVTQQVPCVLSLIRAYNQGKLKRNHLEDALVGIEKFHFLFTAITPRDGSFSRPSALRRGR